MLTDPMFYAVALPAVTLYGLSKGGLAGVGLLAVPLMSLVMSPVRAAAILLPVLIVQDMVTVHAFRRDWDRHALAYILPGAGLGIGLGLMTAAYVTDGAIRLAVGLLAVAFCLNAWLNSWLSKTTRANTARPHSALAGTVFGTMAGYSSFVIHAGGPPYNIYALPRLKDRQVFVGTSAVFFAVLNVVKVPSFFVLGQFSIENFYLSLMLIPVAIVANLAGIQIVQRMPIALFYRIIYSLTFGIGLKLTVEGIYGVLRANA